MEILIAEPDVNMRDLYQMVVGLTNHTIVFCVTIEEVSKALKQHKPGLVITPLCLPWNRSTNADLGEGVYQIRALNKDVPILIATGNIPAVGELDFDRLPNVGLLEKPFKIKDLLDILKRVEK